MAGSHRNPTVKREVFSPCQQEQHKRCAQQIREWKLIRVCSCPCHTKGKR